MPRNNCWAGSDALGRVVECQTRFGSFPVGTSAMIQLEPIDCREPASQQTKNTVGPRHPRDGT